MLFREKNHCHQVELALTKAGVRYCKLGGGGSNQDKHVANVMAVLKWIENPADHISGSLALCALPGVGKTSAGKVLSQTKKLADLYTGPGLRPKSCLVATWDIFVELVRKLNQGKTAWQDEVRLVFGWYAELMAAKIDRSHERPLQLLQALASAWASRRDFLTDAALDQSFAGFDDDDHLTLSTIHSAKGREWHTVYVLNVIDGGIPSSRAGSDETEEERRLLYVAMTRARRRLVLIAPKKRDALSWQPGQLSPRASLPSQFLEGDIERKLKRVCWKL